MDESFPDNWRQLKSREEILNNVALPLKTSCIHLSSAAAYFDFLVRGLLIIYIYVQLFVLHLLIKPSNEMWFKWDSIFTLLSPVMLKLETTTKNFQPFSPVVLYFTWREIPFAWQSDLIYFIHCNPVSWFPVGRCFDIIFSWYRSFGTGGCEGHFSHRSHFSVRTRRAVSVWPFFSHYFE